MELASLSPESVRVVQYTRPVSLLDFGVMAGASSGDSSGLLLELTAPRAYYLASTMPPLMSTYTVLLGR
jgi:hypothetical protein